MTENADPHPFSKIESADELQVLVDILKTRIPGSGSMYNMMLKYRQFQDLLTVYTLHGEPPSASSTWIMCLYIRQDYGKDITISPPPNPKIDDELRFAFSNSKLFNWDVPYCFSCIPRPISTMLVEISCLKGNATAVKPCNFYYFPSNATMTLAQFITQINSEETLEIKSLNSTEGIQFMYETWPHSREGSREYIEKVVGELESAGLFISGKLVSGVLTSGNGFMGMLFTLKEFRNKKYGQVCMKELIRKLRNQGFIPCSIVEVKNKASNRFHETIGMKLSHEVDVIIYSGSQF